VPAPVIFAKPSDIDLPDDPIRPNWVIEGTPRVRSKRVAESGDGTSSVMVWSCTAGRFNWYYSVEETLHIISGEVFVTNEKGEVRRLAPGDMAFFPAGSRSVWHVPHHVLKLAVCRHRMPWRFGLALRMWNKAFDVLTGFSAGDAAPDYEPAQGVADVRARAA
jgi:uncharacterized cupin superfamily protein